MPKIQFSISATSQYEVHKLEVSYSPKALWKNFFPDIIILLAQLNTSKSKSPTHLSIIWTWGAGSLQALAMFVGLKEANGYFFMFDMIIAAASARDRIQSITSAQGKILGRVATFVMAYIFMFKYNGMSSEPASRMVLSLIIW